MKTKKKVVEIGDHDEGELSSLINKKSAILYASISSTRIQETKGVFDTLKEALKSMTIKFIKPTENVVDSGGLTINAFDKKTQALIKQKIYHSTFKEFYLSESVGNEYSIGVDVKLFAAYIKQAGNNDTLIWYIDQNDTNELVFIFQNSAKKLINIRRLTLLKIAPETIKITTAGFLCHLSIPSEDFHKYIKDSSCTSDKITISFIDTKDTQNTIVLSDPKNISSCVFTEATEGVTIVKTNQPGEDIIIRKTYIIKNFVIFIKSQSYCSTVELFLSNTYPLIVNYGIKDYGYTILILPHSNENMINDDDDFMYKDDSDDDNSSDEEKEQDNLVIDDDL